MSSTLKWLAARMSFHLMCLLALIPLSLESCISTLSGTRLAIVTAECVVLTEVTMSHVTRWESKLNREVGGGAVYLSSEAARLDVFDSAFIRCSAQAIAGLEVHGGACWLSSGTVSFARTCASQCFCTGFGHFASLDGRAGGRALNLTAIVECAPAGATATRSGGIHFGAAGDFALHATNFTKCLTRDDGAALHADSLAASFAARCCEFRQCEAATSAVSSNCQRLPTIELSNIVSNVLTSLNGGALLTSQSAMAVRQCVFKGNTADISRAGAGPRFRVSGCFFDGALPHDAVLDSREGNVAFATATLLVNAQPSARHCESGWLAHGPERGSPEASTHAALQSFRGPEGDSRMSTVACIVAPIVSFLSIALFLYVLFRSRVQEAGNASAPSYDVVAEVKEEFIDLKPKPNGDPVVSA
jgi:hypothetical protein